MPLTSTLIPTNWTACVAGANYNTGCFYLLVKGGQTMIMFTHPVYRGDAPFDYPGLQRITKDFDDGMELIQEVMDELEFGRWSWAFFGKQGDGTVRLRHYRPPTIAIPRRIWTHIVKEEEIDVKGWTHICERHGLWKGRNVDLFIAWDEISAIRVTGLTEGHHKLQDLDLTFQVLGHVERHGEVVGLMTEYAHGRRVQLEDRTLVWDAVAKLCHRRILLHLPDPLSTIYITDGKVRFLDTFKVEDFNYSDMRKFWRLYKSVYLRPLTAMFDQVAREGNVHLVHHRPTVYQVKFIMKNPPLLRSPSPEPSDRELLWIIKFRMVRDDTESDRDNSASRSRSIRSLRRSCSPFYLAPEFSSYSEGNDRDVDDMPHTPRRLSEIRARRSRWPVSRPHAGVRSHSYSDCTSVSEITAV